MLRNYLKTSLRSLARRKMYTGINIFGLSIGIVSCFLISLYVYDELSYDRFVTDGDRIYRVALERVYPDHTRAFASSPVTLAPTLLENYPDVEAATRLHRLFFSPTAVVTVGDRSFEESTYLFADSNFFKVFPMPFLEGEPAGALSAEEKVILTYSTARRYFGTDKALGKTIVMGGTDHVVSAVVADVPPNSHMSFDVLGSIQDIEYLRESITNNNWTAPWLYTYVKLHESASPEAFTALFPGMVEEFALPHLLASLNILDTDWASSGHEFNFFLQPLHDIHLRSALDVELRPNGNLYFVYLLASIVGFILLISCFNFVNLETATSPDRAREVGIRKALGSFRSQLVGQFLSEAILVALVSMILAIVLAWVLLPVFNDLTAKQLSLSVMLNPEVSLGLLGFTLLVGLAAGAYPALVISRMQPAFVLKGSYRSSSRGIWLRNSLVFIQYVISIGLISGTLIIQAQMVYLSDHILGFDQENVLVVKQLQGLEGAEALKADLSRLATVESVGGANRMPGDFFGSTIFLPDDATLNQLRSSIMTIDADYLAAMGIELISGRGFSSKFDDSASIIINRAAAETLGYLDPVGRSVIQTGLDREFMIVGVVDNFNFESLHQRVFPMVLFNGGKRFEAAVLAVRLHPDNLNEAIESIREVWRDHVPDQELIYSFFETDLEKLYESERAASRIFNSFSLLAILIACVGLFGMAAYTAHQKTKEIGIRKILGASTTEIVWLLLTEFIYLILVATIVAGVFAHLAMTAWLSKFAYHIDINIAVYALSGGLALGLAWLAISYHSFKSARTNPVKSLGSE